MKNQQALRQKKIFLCHIVVSDGKGLSQINKRNSMKKKWVRLEIDTRLWNYIKLVASLKDVTVGAVLEELIKGRMENEKDVTITFGDWDEKENKA